MKCPHCGGDIASVMAAAGSAGGKARAAKLTKARRSEIAREAAKTRWLKPAKRKGTK
jgi:uncharacterized protein (UPF0212 family)